MKLANRISRIKPSPTMAVAARAKVLKSQGVDITFFGLGEPDFSSPPVAAEAGIEAIRSGETRYTAPSGTDELKSAIVQKLKRENQLSYSNKEVIASCGAKHTLYNIAQVLFEEGDEVIIPAPYWVSYPDQVLLAGARPVIVTTREKDGFLMTPDQLKKAITPRTKGIILNSPSNPTGAVYSAAHYEALADLLLKTPLTIIADEVYEKFLYGDAVHHSIAALIPALKDKTIVVNAVSKTYSMTGWRIGYAAGPEEIIQAMSKVQSQSTSNPASISQKAAAAALLHGAPFVEKMLKAFGARRALMLEKLNQMDGVSCAASAGSFYLFPNVKALLKRSYQGRCLEGSTALASFLLEEGGVATISGEAFGADGYLRLSYASSEEVLSRGLDKIAQAISKLK